MLHIIISVLLICGMGLITVESSLTVYTSARPGDNVTIWCQHTAGTGEYVHWFKQRNGAVPLSIVYKMITFQFKEQHIKYFNDFQQDHMLMSLNDKSTSLSILNVDISDSGLYFCGWSSWEFKFGDGTHLNMKESECATPLQNETEISNKDIEENPVSTRDCSENIFYKLTFILGAIIVILIIILVLIFIIKIQKRRNQRKDADSNATQHHEMVYAALQFKKQKTRRAARHVEDIDVVYSATR